MESLFDFLSTLEFRPCLLNRRDWLNISKKGGWLGVGGRCATVNLRPKGHQESIGLLARASAIEPGAGSFGKPERACQRAARGRYGRSRRIPDPYRARDPLDSGRERCGGVYEIGIP